MASILNAPPREIEHDCVVDRPRAERANSDSLARSVDGAFFGATSRSLPAVPR
jgi:hypothetical protein